MGLKAVPELELLWKTGADSKMRARAFWVLVKMPGGTPSVYINEAARNASPDIRILAIRAARELKLDILATVKQLSADRDHQVLRECAIALRHLSTTGSPEVWAVLANAHTGADRWYLEALGIGADRQWDSFFKAWLQKQQIHCSRPHPGILYGDPGPTSLSLIFLH